MSSLPHALLPLNDFRTSIRALRAFLFPERKPVTGKAPAAGFELHEHVGADRAAVEAFISQCFAESFGCRIEAFMPRLFSLRNRDGDICGALGLRSANRNLFLEQYLDTPIEKIIAAHAGANVARRTVVEVGHFSGAFPGAVRTMIGLLTERLHHEGIEWVAFTGTTDLRNAFFRLGLSPVDIQAATADRLPAEERAAWGSYYDHAPRVLIGNVLEGYRAMLPHATPSRTQPGDIE
jgi:hypothetical protein